MYMMQMCGQDTVDIRMKNLYMLLMYLVEHIPERKRI